jgi:hypothetical protein
MHVVYEHTVHEHTVYLVYEHTVYVYTMYVYTLQHTSQHTSPVRVLSRRTLQNYSTPLFANGTSSMHIVADISSCRTVALSKLHVVTTKLHVVIKQHPGACSCKYC